MWKIIWKIKKKIGAISQLGAEKITFPPKPDGQTYGQTDRRTDICYYRVALLLKMVIRQLLAVLGKMGLSGNF